MSDSPGITSDLSPIEITEINLGATVLRPTRPIVATVTVDPDPPAMWFAHIFGQSVFSHARTALPDELADLIGFLWREYAAAPDESMTADAIAIAEQLRAAFTEVTPGRPTRPCPTHADDANEAPMEITYIDMLLQRHDVFNDADQPARINTNMLGLKEALLTYHYCGPRQDISWNIKAFTIGPSISWVVLEGEPFFGSPPGYLSASLRFVADGKGEPESAILVPQLLVSPVPLPFPTVPAWALATIAAEVLGGSVEITL